MSIGRIHQYMRQLDDPQQGLFRRTAQEKWDVLKAFVETLHEDKQTEAVPQGKRGWMCLTDFQHELGEADGGVRVFPDRESLAQHKPCISECGVIEVVVAAAPQPKEQSK